MRSFVRTERIGTLFLGPSATLQGFADVAHSGTARSFARTERARFHRGARGTLFIGPGAVRSFVRTERIGTLLLRPERDAAVTLPFFAPSLVFAWGGSWSVAMLTL